MDASIVIAYTSMMIMLVTLSAMMKRKMIFIAIGVVFVGIFCNVFVVKSNGGKMPVFIKNMSEYAKADLRIAPRHQAGTLETKHAYLADFIAVKKSHNIYSPGDISMAIGPVALALSVLWQIMCTLRHDGITGFMRNNQPISYHTSAMAICAVYLGCRHIILYA